MKTRHASWRTQCVAGALSTPRAATLFLGHPSLWPWAIAPVLVNMAMFLGLAAAFLTLGNAFFLEHWALPSGAMLILWWSARVLSWAVSILLAYMSAAIATTILAGPFLEVLSLKTEKLLLGAHYRETVSGPLLSEILQGALGALLTTLLYLCIMGPLLLLNLIPGVGSVAYLVLAALIGGYFLSIEYTGMALARRAYTLKSQMNLLKSHRPLSLGFGIGTSLLMLIPFVNLLCSPLAVIAGTIVGVELHERKCLGAYDEASSSG